MRPPKEKFYSRAWLESPHHPGRRPMRTFFAALFLLAAASAHAQYPQRPVQLIVPWGAGGGTDATARIIATLLEKDLKQPFNVVNRTGGSGVVGHTAIAGAPPAGYTIGMLKIGGSMEHWQGVTQIRPEKQNPP